MNEIQVQFVANLTADPELRFTLSGQAVASVRLAQTPRVLNRQTQQWEDAETTFFAGSVWGQYAENVAASLAQGARVVVIGTLRSRSYTRDGMTRTATDLRIEEIAPSLRFATAKVQKVSRGVGRPEHAPAEDPWATGPQDPSADQDEVQRLQAERTAAAGLGATPIG